MGFLILPDPRIEGYLRTLHRINEIYSDYEIDNVDLSDKIDYYYSKNDYSDDEIKDLQSKCNSEWKNVLISLCEKLKNKIEDKEYYTKLLKNELNQCKKIYNELINEEKTLDEYETIFGDKLSVLQDTVNSNIVKEEKDRNRFWIGVGVGVLMTIITIGLSIIIYLNSGGSIC